MDNFFDKRKNEKVDITKETDNVLFFENDTEPCFTLERFPKGKWGEEIFSIEEEAEHKRKLLAQKNKNI